MNNNNNISVNGIAHIALSVKSLNISKKFYKKLMPFLGLSLIHESNKSIYFIGSRTGILVQEIKKGKVLSNFSQDNVGLHHFCFRAREKEDIFLVQKKLVQIKAKIIRGPLEGSWAPGYFYILFEDPDKIRLEVNYVPDKGVLQKNIKFNPSNDY
ncbi:VOC family protein [Alphaproteobacteria bacterium]|nr:VOC family protein [Alphaproteobacteria bacterium]